MIEKLISEYVNRMTINDVSKFALENGISLNKKELNLIFNQIKESWHTIVYGNPRGILDNLRNEIDSTTYQKIENLYISFKEKFRNYI